MGLNTSVCVCVSRLPIVGELKLIIIDDASGEVWGTVNVSELPFSSLPQFPPTQKIQDGVSNPRDMACSDLKIMQS